MNKPAFILGAVLAVGFGGAALKAAELVIDQTGQQFSVKKLEAKVGDVIKFTNSDDVTHNVSISSDDADDDLGLQKPGESITAKLTQAGEYSVYCHIHPKMKMKVIVQ